MAFAGAPRPEGPAPDGDVQGGRDDGGCGAQPHDLLQLLEQGGDGLIAFDADWRCTYVNRAAARMIRRPAPDLVGAVLWSAYPEAVGSAAYLHYQRAMRERVPVDFEARSVVLDRWIEQRCLPTPDGGLLVLFRDVSPRKRVEESLRHGEARLRAIVESSTECITTLDRHGRLLSMNAGGRAAMEVDDFRDVEGADWTGMWQEEYREDARRALETAGAGRPASFQGWRDTAKGTPRWWAVTVTSLPESAADRGAPGNGEAFLCVSRDMTDQKRADEERARVAARDHRVAETLQQCLLPTHFDGGVAGLSVRALARPARVEEASVGGDFYDAFPLPGGRAALVVGDVMGKGLSAAISIAEVRFALRGFLHEDDDPAGALERLNDVLIASHRLENRPRNVLVSLSVAVLDAKTGEGAVALAGAEAALVHRAATGSVQAIPGRGNLLLGVTTGEAYTAEPFRLDAGDVLLFVTDGVTDARAGKDIFGAEGVAAALGEACAVLNAPGGQTADPDADLGRCANAVADASAAFADGSSLRDDVCLLVARRLPGAGL